MSKVALIPGASRGLGLKLAGFLAKQGYDLVLTARGADALEETARSLEKHGGKVVALAGDISDPEHRRRLTEAAESLGQLDLLVNNASDLGAAPLPPLAEYPLDTIEGVFRVNLIAPLGLVRYQSAQGEWTQNNQPLQRCCGWCDTSLLRESGRKIINLSSDAAVGGYPGWGAC